MMRAGWENRPEEGVHYWHSVILSVLVCAVGGFLAFGCAGKTDPLHVLLAEGWQYLRMGDYEFALADFEEASTFAEQGSDSQLQALYGLATTLRLQSPAEKKPPTALFERILEVAPDSDWAAWSLLTLARMHHLTPVDEEPDYEAARKLYQQVIDRFPNHPASEEAFVFKQVTSLETLHEEHVKDSISTLERFVETRSESPFLSLAYALLASCYGNLEQDERAFAYALKSHETQLQNPLAPSDPSFSYWSLAVRAEFDMGDFDTARHFYEKLISECPNDIHVFAAKKALRRMAEVEARIRAELETQTSSAHEETGP
jgi:tetratricopeptide (TPR) repeat protein